MRFEFATAGRIILGPGTLREAGSLAKDLGRRALVVTGRDLSRAEPLLKLLREEQVHSTVFSVSGEPETEAIQGASVFARREECDFVIGLGGGSVLDSGKAIAALLTNPGDLLDYLEVIGRGKTLRHRSAPFMAIPTTAGTGSEATRNAVLASKPHQVKVSLRSPFMLPTVAVIDPELAIDLPPDITASTGLDALTQLIEPYVCNRTNPMTDALCIEGMRKVARSIRTVVNDGRQLQARTDMAVASLFGGMALANAGLGAVHGFAGPIGGMFPARHGAVCAALLPHVMEANLKALRDRQPGGIVLGRYDEIARLLTGNSQADADAGEQWVRKLVADLQIPPLRAYGIRTKDTSKLVEHAIKASSMKANPIELRPAELEAILERALEASP